ECLSQNYTKMTSHLLLTLLVLASFDKAQLPTHQPRGTAPLCASNDLYPKLLSKAAALLDSLIRNHPFPDGNKRTGIAAALFLGQNGYRLTAFPEDLEAFALCDVESSPEIAEITNRLKEHSAPEKGS
ncbi:MAG: type II toxin-antitoxin system death-on-curing family toxin, partial [Anaerolineales bacterium]